MSVVKVTVCVGSSCSVRGSDELAAKLEELIADHGVDGAVNLVGSFCMGKCSRGITVAVDDDVFQGIEPADAELFYADHIASRVGNMAVTS